MPKTVTGSGSWRLGTFSMSGSGGVPVPDPGPNTRGLIAGLEIKFSGAYSDEVDVEAIVRERWFICMKCEHFHEAKCELISVDLADYVRKVTSKCHIGKW